jgi:hypothetical protein
MIVVQCHRAVVVGGYHSDQNGNVGHSQNQNQIPLRHSLHGLNDGFDARQQQLSSSLTSVHLVVWTGSKVSEQLVSTKSLTH